MEDSRLIEIEEDEEGLMEDSRLIEIEEDEEGLMEDSRLIEIEEDEEDFMEDSRLIEIEEDEDEEDFTEDSRLIEIEEDEEDFGDEEEEEDAEYDEGEEVAHSTRVERIMHWDYDDEDEYGDYEVDDDEVNEVYDSFLGGMPSQGAAVINNGLLDDLNNLQSCEGKPANQETGEGGGGSQELNRGEIDGLLCPICFQAWTNGGEHRICCLPCGHIYGLSCIKKWLQRSPNSRKCPQCNSLCTMKDVRVLYTAGLCVADEKFQNKVLSLEAKCVYLEQKGLELETQLQHERMDREEMKTSIERHLEDERMYREKMDARMKEMEARMTEIQEHLKNNINNSKNTVSL